MATTVDLYQLFPLGTTGDVVATLETPGGLPLFDSIAGVSTPPYMASALISTADMATSARADVTGVVATLYPHWDSTSYIRWRVRTVYQGKTTVQVYLFATPESDTPVNVGTLTPLEAGPLLFGVKDVEVLGNGLTAEITSRKLTLQAFEHAGGISQLSALANSSAEEITLMVKRIDIAVGQWAIINPGTPTCTVRQITSIDDEVVSFAGKPLDTEFASGTVVNFVQYPEWNPLLFGAAVGTGVASGVKAANRTALVAAAGYAQDNNAAITLPPGRLEVDLGDTVTTTLNLSTDVKIVGAGIDRTVLAFDAGTSANSDKVGIQVPLNGNATIADLTIEGPAASSNALTTTSASRAFGATSLSVASNTGFSGQWIFYTLVGGVGEWNYVTSTSGSTTLNLLNPLGFNGIASGAQVRVASTLGVQHAGGAGTVTLRNVKFSATHKFTHAIKTNDGTALVEIDHCDVTALQIGCLHTADSGGALHIMGDSYFHDIGTTSLHHCLYINFGVSVNISNSRFGSTAGYNLHYNGGSGVPAYSIINSCTFNNPTGSAGILTASASTTQITNCTFYGGPGISVRTGTTLVDNCYFYGTIGIQTFTAASLTSNAIIRGCRFVTSSTSVAISQTNYGWLISDCQFYNSGANSYGVLISNSVIGAAGAPPIASGVGGARIHSCRFEGVGIDHIRVDDTVSTIPVLIENCRFIGICSSYAIYFSSTTAGTSPGVITDCRFLYVLAIDASGNPVLDGGGLQIHTFTTAIRGSNSLQLRGRDNYFDAGITLPVAVTSSKFAFRLPNGIGASVAAATTIVLDWNYDTYHITAGAATITGISFASIQALTTRVYLIIDSAVAFSNANNLIVQNAGVNRVVGECVELQYDPTTAKWYEIY